MPDGKFTQKALEQLFKIARGADCDGGGEQVLALADAGKHRLVDVPQVQPGVVAEDLRVVGWIAVDERDREAEAAGVEVTRALDVSDEELRFDGVEMGHGS